MGNDTRSSGYSSNDVMKLSNAPVGSSVFTRHFKTADEAVEKILERRSKHDRTDSVPSRFGLQESSLQMSASDLCRKTVMEELANKMNDQDLGTTVIDLVLQSQSFQDCIKLCYDCEDMWSWFEAFVVCDDVDIIRPFHVIVRRLF